MDSIEKTGEAVIVVVYYDQGGKTEKILQALAQEGEEQVNNMYQAEPKDQKIRWKCPACGKIGKEVEP